MSSYDSKHPNNLVLSGVNERNYHQYIMSSYPPPPMSLIHHYKG